MTPKQKMAHELRKAGLTLQGVGDVMGISRQAVWGLLNRDKTYNYLNSPDVRVRRNKWQREYRRKLPKDV